jgi:hypothetical protein
MHSNNIRCKVLLPLALALAVFTLFPALAQERPPQLELGKIKGTDMLRDEFRARGLAQLSAIMLNALTYYEIEGKYPDDFYKLRGSKAWNIDVKNIFSGRPIQAVSFEPQDSDLTTSPPLNVISLDIPSTNMPVGSATDENGSFDPKKMADIMANQGPRNVSRVDPLKVREPEPGEVFYYAAGSLIQLIIYAPDGTFAELVNEVPNRSWLFRYRTNAMAQTWPDDLYAAEVLFYLEQIMPQYYNMVQFMGDKETTPRGDFPQMGGDELLLLADELGITPLNPVTRKPLALAADPAKDGDLCEPDPASRSPLHICLPGRRVMTLDELRVGATGAEQVVTQPQPAQDTRHKRRGQKSEQPKAPPMGGRG